MNDPDNLSEYSMIDLFRMEVESHAATLSNGLLDMEHRGTETDIESLMRAAHSIKGGARIVEIDAAVQVAHALEDCFVAMQEKAIIVSPEGIDQLLEAVDFLVQLAEQADADKQPDAGTVNRIIQSVRESVREPIQSGNDDEPPEPAMPVPDTASSEAITDAISSESFELYETGHQTSSEPDGDPAISDIPDADMIIPDMADNPATEAATDAQGRIVRVTSGKLERLMGLTGEVVVGTRWLAPFMDSLIALKRHQNKLADTLETLQKEIESSPKNRKPAKLLCKRARERVRRCNQQLAEQLDSLDGFTSRTTHLSDRLYNEMISIRMCQFSQGVQGYPRMVRDLARELGKSAHLEIEGLDTEVDRDILEKLDTALVHLLRNGVDHGLESPEERRAAGKPETGQIRLSARHRAGMLLVTVADDGRGIDPESLRRTIIEKKTAPPDIAEKLTEPELMEFLFLPKFTTTETVTEVSGRGVGLDVVRSTVHEVGGVVRAHTTPGRGMTFQMELPLTLSVIRTFLVEISGEPYAFPLARIDRCLRLDRSEIHLAEGRHYFHKSDDNIALVDSHEILEFERAVAEGDDNRLNVVVISDRVHGYGLTVDKFLGEYDLVVRPLDPRLGKIPDVSAAAIMIDGSPVLIFDVEDMINSISKLLQRQGRLNRIESAEHSTPKRPPRRILVVEDSFVVREKERRLLESRGYDVDVAVDGMDGWNMLRANPYDMVLSDIDMPRMNGIELVREIRGSLKLKEVPVIIVSYKSSEEDRLAGLEAGANYYLPKTDFDDTRLINAVIDLIGKP